MALSAQLYRYMLNFLASQPTPEQISEFRPTLEMQERLRYLLGRERDGELSADEYQELNEYERIEHLIIMLKTSSLPNANQDSGS
ncbi:MAG: hypothetical protein AAGG51_29960 [Cyanobacteria bacterium P01_G01_bin.54]